MRHLNGLLISQFGPHAHLFSFCFHPILADLALRFHTVGRKPWAEREPTTMTQTTTALPPLSAAWDPSLATPDTDEFCWTPLQLAARAGDIAEMQRILAENPAAANDPPCGYYGQTALQAACMHGHEAAVRLLLDVGADVHFSGGNNFQRNALQIACGNGDDRIVEMLLAAGARVNEVMSASDGRAHKQPSSGPSSRIKVTRYNGRTALQAACDRGHKHLAERLLRLGADVNAPPSPTAGCTAIQAAARGGYLPIVELLLQHGADANAAAARHKGYTALQGACRGGHADIVERLLQLRAVDVDALGGMHGDGTALHAAAEGGNADVIRMLLATGANINARSWKRGRGHTALQSALAAGHDEAARVLRESGATERLGGGYFLFS
ncbi:hypothetical protein LMH87_007357 [Akanthomyces muscarius]|uniref:Ankyrin repeat protein n=1 Tax=Akanthomyces muscarius TaxID=2231603 RepID=A0A9W8QSY0_AKAMU|nr:hypothetical protein LMH87_007357 [Akanthomyces muscarius]KAJ4165737.1 hypothetical protein LMH87_007357 [Akanthomyces muscarius]